MKRRRPAEVTYYEWYVAMWRASSTRMMLDGAGRGIYRELLDNCYQQGSILNPEADPTFLKALAQDCAVTEEQFRSTWQIIRRHFTKHESDERLLVNRRADAIRKETLRYLKSQAKHGRSGGLKKARLVSPEESEASVGFAKGTLAEQSSTGLEIRKPNINQNNINTNIKEKTIQHSPNPSVESALFDYESHFAELWQAYPQRGRSDIEDSKRWYVDAVSPDPERIHAQIMATVLPGGKWAESDLWNRGMVKALKEFLRNRKWLEDPVPYDPNAQQQQPPRKSAAQEAFDRA